MRSVELFAGAGGLAIGMANAGFHHAAVIEWNKDACRTFRHNQTVHTKVVKDWPLHEVDAKTFNYANIPDEISVVSGGPPCQPFSLGGKHRGHMDTRDMFPEAVRAVRELRPKAFIFENVKGLLRESFANYFGYTLLQLQYPDITRHAGEDWRRHRARLESIHTAGGPPTYNVIFELLNAANYGVPQKRERVFIVGFRADLAVKWNFPHGDFSEDALLRAKWVTGEYWDRHQVPARRRSMPPARFVAKINRLRTSDLIGDARRPWLTVRDAIASLPDPEREPNNRMSNHIVNPGARPYSGHTGSPLDEPAKTLKAGDHGVPGGENMLVLPDGTVRYFTIREAARLQTFPDEYVFPGSWSESMRQLGNAVPVKLAEVIARSVLDALSTFERVRQRRSRRRENAA